MRGLVRTQGPRYPGTLDRFEVRKSVGAASDRQVHPQAGQRIERRAVKRTPVPLMTGAIRAELVTPEQVFPRGQLWDISPIGACLVVRDFIDELLDDALVTVRLICDSTHQMLEVQGRARWTHPDHSSTFLGIHFAEGQLPEGRFLDAYLDPHWAD